MLRKEILSPEFSFNSLAFSVDCKTVVFLRWSYECARSLNERSGASVNTESGTGERRSYPKRQPKMTLFISPQTKGVKFVDVTKV